MITRWALVGIACVIAAALLWVSTSRALRTGGYENDSHAIGDLRTMLSAETAYQSANQGWFDTVECLVRPRGCIPGYTGPSFLNADFARELRYCYHFEFHPGSAAGADAVRAMGASPSSLSAFAYVAEPSNRCAERAYCIDSSKGWSGSICATRGGRPRVERGACVITPGGAPGKLWAWSTPEDACYALK